jgi:hypothetical protein
MALDRDKFKSLVHYVCWKCVDPSTLGAVKLNKILWLSDFSAFSERGEAITGSRYIKRQYGPVPSAVEPALYALQSEGSIMMTAGLPFHAYRKKEFRALSVPAMGAFGQEELRIVDRIIDFVCNEHTAKSISELSHDHVWRAAEEGEEIPYFTTFAVRGEIEESDREWARQELEARD